MVKQLPVNIKIQILIGCIPFYGWIYTFYRIEKLKLGSIIILITFLSTMGLQMILTFPHGIIGSVVIYFILPIPFIWKWSNDWNKKFIDIP
jgi:hypothetical protein